MPKLEKELWQPLKDRGLSVLAIGREHSKQELIDFKNQLKLTMPVIVDSKREIYSKFATSSIPRNYLIDKEGRVIYASTGYTSADAFRILTLIKGELGLPGGAPSPITPPSQLELSRQDVFNCKYESAITRLRALLERNAKNAQAHYLLGVTYANMKQYDQAAECYRSAFNCAQDPKMKELAKLGLSKIHRPVLP